jgi:choline dehydrogenase-like flavoprotein
VATPKDRIPHLSPELRVRGVEGLRVIDTDMPRLVTPTRMPHIMIGEKGAELVARAPLGSVDDEPASIRNP